MSARNGIALPPAARISFAVSSTMALSPRPLTTTAAPSYASASTIALPIFLPEPLTIATLPASACASAMSRSLRFLCPLADLAGAFGAGGHQEADIVAGERQLHAHADIALQQVLGIDAGHARVFAVLAAGGDRRLVGGGHAFLAEIARQS